MPERHGHPCGGGCGKLLLDDAAYCVPCGLEANRAWEEAHERWPCTWLVEVPSGHPEPDSYADTVRIVECGHTARPVGAGWECEAGHRYRGIEVEWAEDAQVALC